MNYDTQWAWQSLTWVPGADQQATVSANCVCWRARIFMPAAKKKKKVNTGEKKVLNLPATVEVPFSEASTCTTPAKVVQHSHYMTVCV